MTNMGLTEVWAQVLIEGVIHLGVGGIACLLKHHRRQGLGLSFSLVKVWEQGWFFVISLTRVFYDKRVEHLSIFKTPLTERALEVVEEYTQRWGYNFSTDTVCGLVTRVFFELFDGADLGEVWNAAQTFLKSFSECNLNDPEERLILSHKWQTFLEQTLISRREVSHNEEANPEVGDSFPF
mgnify:CR=1 FL=1